MNTLHFRYAVEIEKTRSITQAAENLYMAQPNMSKAIKELENTLGITIFKRTSKGVIPTEQGIKFLEYAKQVLIQIDNMEAIHAPENMQKQHLRISVPRANYIAAAFSDFTSGFDTSNDIEVYFQETDSLKTIANVRENSYDFGIIRYKTAHEKYFSDYLSEKALDSQLIWEFEMLALMPASHPLAECENLSYTELSDTSAEIISGDNSVPYLSPSGANLAETNRKNCRRIHVFDRASAYDILSTVSGSFMLVSPQTQEICNRFNLVQRKCSFEGNQWKDILVYPSGHKLSSAEIQLLNRIYQTRNSVAFADYR